jgi:hypothetical protein
MIAHTIEAGDTTQFVVCIDPIEWKDTCSVSIVSDAWDSPTIVPVILYVVTEVETNETPKSLSIVSNSPNPFNPPTTIKYTTPKLGHVNLRIYDVAGRLVNTLINEEKRAGGYSVIWRGNNNNGAPVSAGIYFLKLEACGQVQTSKVALLK